MIKLLSSALRTFLLGAVVFAAILFIPAGTLRYWQAWIFIVVFMLCANFIGVYLAIKDPALLERRKNFGPAAEPKLAQKIIMSIGLAGILAVLVFSVLDHRFAWTHVPPFVSLLGDGLVALGFYIDLLVFKENTFGASNIQTEAGQKVITTGLYAFIRHPMYAGALVMLLGVPLALGSYWGLAVIAAILPALIWRIVDEEKLLRTDLPGYPEYAQKVHYRLVPGVW